MNLGDWEPKFSQKIISTITSVDPAHDLLHFKRVVKIAKALAIEEGAKLEVVVPAAWLHDLVVVPKNSPDRTRASKLSANAAVSWLTEIGYPEDLHPEISHAIEAHSFSANIKPETIEAMIVQDADRLDGIGAIGVARCFATAGLLSRPFYSETDAFCEHRKPDDGSYTVDHFYQKLFKVPENLHTQAAKAEGKKRAKYMAEFLRQLMSEVQ